MSIYEIGPFHLEAAQLLLLRRGTPVALGPKVVGTLLALAEHPGEVLTKRALMDRIWPEGFVEESNLAQNIHVLRKTFRHHGCADPIETIPLRGYRLNAPVREVDAVPSAPLVPRRLAAAIAGVAFIAASVAFVASYGFGDRTLGAPSVLSTKGARLYGIGRFYWNQRTRDGVRRSLTYFAQTIDTDPQNAQGYAALADANVAMGDYCYGTHLPDVYFARAHEYAEKALALDANSAEAHAALGHIALDRSDMPTANAELLRAIAIDPAYAPAHEWYGITLLRDGRRTEAVAQLKAAANIDPLSVSTIAWLASAAYQERRFGDAIAYSRQALELSPRRLDALSTMGEAYEAQGDTARAIAAFERYGAVGPYYRPEAAVLMAHAYALAHREGQARALLTYARLHARDVDAQDLATAERAVGAAREGTAQNNALRAHDSSMYA